MIRHLLSELCQDVGWCEWAAIELQDAAGDWCPSRPQQPRELSGGVVFHVKVLLASRRASLPLHWEGPYLSEVNQIDAETVLGSRVDGFSQGARCYPSHQRDVAEAGRAFLSGYLLLQAFQLALPFQHHGRPGLRIFDEMTVFVVLVRVSNHQRGRLQGNAVVRCRRP